MNKILIIGVGNYLMGDEGVGVHAIKEIEKLKLPDYVKTLDGGTGGFHLLSFFHNYKTVIMIDAAMDGNEDGNVRVIEPKFATDFPRSLSAHDIGLRDLIETAALTRELPKIYLIIVSVSSLQNMNIELSPEVKAAIPVVVQKTKEILTEITG